MINCDQYSEPLASDDGWDVEIEELRTPTPEAQP